MKTNPTNGDGLDATNIQPAKALTKHADYFIATLAWTASQYWLCKMIQWQDGALLATAGLMVSILLNLAVEVFHHG